MADLQQILVRDGERHAPPDGSLSGGSGSIAWRTLHGGMSEGVQVVTLTNGGFSVTVCPTRGMGVLSADAAGTYVGWHSPVAAPVHPQHVNLKARNGLGWLDGFNELLCRCGLAWFGPPGVDDGAASPIESDLTLHGRIANIPAHSVEVGCDEANGRLWITGECRESTMFGPHLVLRSTIWIPLEGAAIHVEDAVSNHGAGPTELQLLYHINIGPPFLGEGSQFLTASRQMTPRDDRAAEDADTFARYLGPTPGYSEQVYFFDAVPDADGQASALLRNRSGDLGVSVAYDRAQLPCLSLWKCTQPAADGYVTGIEPGTGFPNFKTVERESGRVTSLAPGDTYRTSVTLAVHAGADAVGTFEESIHALQRVS